MGERLRQGIRQHLESLVDHPQQPFPPEAPSVPNVPDILTMTQQQARVLRNYAGLPLLEEAALELSAKYPDAILTAPTENPDPKAPISIVLSWGAHYENGRTTWNEVVGIPRSDTDFNLVYVLLLYGTNAEGRFLHATWDSPEPLEDHILQAVRNPIVRSVKGFHPNVLPIRNQVPLFPKG